MLGREGGATNWDLVPSCLPWAVHELNLFMKVVFL